MGKVQRIFKGDQSLQEVMESILRSFCTGESCGNTDKDDIAPDNQEK